MGNLLGDHLNAVEGVLLEQSKIPANAGHSLNQGTPRENFIKTFLEGHLSERVAIGQGEIVGATSQSGELRNQIDIVIYRRNFPRIEFSAGVVGFLVESVVATIEVKSTLRQGELEKAIQTAHTLKQLPRNTYTVWTSGYQPPSILSYVVAYDGPVHTKTVLNWLNSLHRKLHIEYPRFPVNGDATLVAGPSIDGIFTLGKGFVQYANAPLTWPVIFEARKQHPDMQWYGADVERGSLALLFLLLTTAINSMADTYLQPSVYLPIIRPAEFSICSANRGEEVQ